MTIVGRIATRPANSAPPIRYLSWVDMLCLLCGKKATYALDMFDLVIIDEAAVYRDPMVVTFCDCYDSTHQDVRMIPND